MKNSVIRELSNEELAERIAEERMKMTKTNLSHAVSPLESPILLRINRKTIARLLTEQGTRMNKAN